MSLSPILKTSLGSLYEEAPGQYVMHLVYQSTEAEWRKVGYKTALTIFDGDPDSDAVYNSVGHLVTFQTNKLERVLICIRGTGILYEEDVYYKQKELLRRLMKPEYVTGLRVNSTRRVDLDHTIVPNEYEVRYSGHDYNVDARGCRCLYIERLS